MPDRISPRLWGRPTTYKGIKMRSRTEATYAARLDNAGITWQYEPQCFADETRQYLPDFRILDRDVVVYIEVKGALPLSEVGAVQHRMEVIWASEPKAMLVIAIISTGDSYHSGPDEPREWFHQNPNRWTDPKPKPPPSASARLALGGVRKAPIPAAGVPGARLALGGVRSAPTAPEGLTPEAEAGIRKARAILAAARKPGAA